MSTHEHEHTSHKASHDEPHAHVSPANEAIDRISKLVGDLASGGARYGLSLGKLALQHSAKSLETTAGFLNDLAAKVDATRATHHDGPAKTDLKG